MAQCDILANNNTMPLETLIEFGLSKTEAITYLALIELGPCGASKIATKTKINRSTTHFILNSLVGMALANVNADTTAPNGVILLKFSATSPDVLLSTVRQRVLESSAIQAKIELAVSELKAKHYRSRPQFHIFEGQEALNLGALGLLNEQIDRGMSICRVFSEPRIENQQSFPSINALKQEILAQKHGKTTLRVLSSDAAQTHTAIPAENQNSHSSPIESPTSDISWTSFPKLVIYQDKVAFNFDGPMTIVIENKQISDVLKNIFDLTFHMRTDKE